MDYREVNKWTVHNNNPLLNIWEALENLRNKTLFSKFDIRWGYNNIRIAKEDQYKAAFKMKHGTFIPQVMYFGLKNVPPFFQRMMHHDFRELLQKYLKSQKLHEQLVDSHGKYLRRNSPTLENCTQVSQPDGKEVLLPESLQNQVWGTADGDLGVGSGSWRDPHWPLKSCRNPRLATSVKGCKTSPKYIRGVGIPTTLHKELCCNCLTTTWSHEEGHTFQLDTGVYRCPWTAHPSGNIWTSAVPTRLV